MDNYSLREIITDLLVRIEKDHAYSHLLIDQTLKSGKVAKKDETLLTEIVYGTFQRKLTLEYYLDPFIHSAKKMDIWVKMLLEMSVYQMIYLDKVPDHAIIHEAVEIAKHKGHKGIGSFVNGVLRNIQRKGVPSTDEIKDPILRIAVETSHPEWLVRRWCHAYGMELTKEMCTVNTGRKPLAVRIQPLRIARDQAIKQLKNEGIEAVESPFSKQGLIVEDGNIFHSALYKDNCLTVQDQSSMLVAEMLQPMPGMKVLDACSAPGGKTTHIAEKMENAGEVYAYDLHKKKAGLVREKAEKLGLSIVTANQADARNLQDIHQNQSFDRILIDAPCSGLGVIRGKPEIKYNKMETDIQRLAEIQLAILKHAAPLLKQDGLLIYSTCTVDKLENEGVVKRFLRECPEFIVDEAFYNALPDFLRQSIGCTEYGLQIFPQTFATDGFFLTRFKYNR